MFNNISGKIKLLALLTFWIGIGASVIFGIVSMIDGATWGNEEDVAFGIFLCICGPLWSWVSSWLLYGFGQLIENSNEIAKTNSILAYGVKEDEVEKLYRVGNQILNENELNRARGNYNHTEE